MDDSKFRGLSSLRCAAFHRSRLCLAAALVFACVAPHITAPDIASAEQPRGLVSSRFAKLGDVEGLVAQVTRPVHPILIRNPQGPLLRLTIELPKGKSLRVTSITYAFDGTDDLNDIDSVRLFATGDQEPFSDAAPIGDEVAPAEKVVVTVNRDLTEGRNVFWLACRLKETAKIGNTVRASCALVTTAAGEFVPQDGPANANQPIGIALRRHQDGGVHTYRIPALTASAKGTLLAVYDMRRREGRDLQEDIDIGLSRSTDGGQTWEEPRVIMDMGTFGGLPQELNGCSDPGIIVDRQTGEIFCFALWMHGKPGKHQWVDDGSEPGFEIGKAAQFMMVRSTDDGLTWTPPENLTKTLKQESWWLFAPSPQAGISLTDGTLVMPVQGRTGREPLATFATVMVSRDHGRSWQVGKPSYSGGNECQAAELSDGSIMLNIRNDHERYRAVVVTKDLGQSWQDHPTSRTTLIEPNCNGSLLRFVRRNGQSDRPLLLFANPHSQQGRTHHTVQVSFDDGRSWPDSHHWLLDEGRGAGYPSMTQIDNDHVGIVYEGSQSHLVFERIAIADLIDPIRRHGTREISERQVSDEGKRLLKQRRQSPPFGATNFDLEGLRSGMGARQQPNVAGVKLAKVDVAGIAGEWVVAQGADPDVRLLYLHGGGWVSGSGGNYLPLAAEISAAAKCAVLLIDYRLAPEHPFPAGLDDCVAAHQWMMSHGPDGSNGSEAASDAKATFVAGDSAGGNLTLATLLALKARKLPYPVGAIAISPATDFTLASDSLRSVDDPIISSRTMPEFRSRYLGKADARDPLASPVFGDYQGLPPILIQSGDEEMLRDDSIRVAIKARGDGVPVELEVWPGMMHVFQIRGLPESRDAVRRIGDFVTRQLGR
jgi:sialidase-1